MRSRRISSNEQSMGPDAFAGFLRLWLTPAHRVPRMTEDVEAYLRHANSVEPLSAETLDVITPRTDRAA